MFKLLQWNRAIAAMAVAAFHMSIIMAEPRYGGEGVFGAYTNRGNLGVDFFFVLSGFIITIAHQRDIGRAGEFGRYVLKRAIRVYPMYFLATALVLAGAFITHGSNRPPSNAADWLTMISLIRFTPFDTPVGAAWTLYFEILFYGLFATLILDRRLGIAVLGVWFCAIVANFHYTPWGQWSFFGGLLSALNLNFFLGMGAALLAKRVNAPTSVALAAAGCALFVGLFVTEGNLGHLPWIQLGFAIAFAAIVAGGAGFETNRTLPDVPPLTFLGNASYTLYLFHENIETTMLKVLAATGLQVQFGGPLTFAVVLLAVILIAAAIYVLVERPLLEFLRRRLLARA